MTNDQGSARDHAPRAGMSAQERPYDEALREIRAGRARGHALWHLVYDEHQRDGFMLRPMPWDGGGEYQHVSFDDGRNGFVRIPGGARSLPTT